MSFDWGLISAGKWSPLSAFTDDPQWIVRGLYRLDEGVFAMTNAGFGETEDDPGVAAVLWAESEAAALLIYESVLPDDSRSFPLVPIPPQEVTGFAPLTYATAWEYESSFGRRPIGVSASYGRLNGDGQHRYTSFKGAGRTYYFRELNPTGDDRVIAISFQVGWTPEDAIGRLAQHIIEAIDNSRDDDDALAKLGTVLAAATIQLGRIDQSLGVAVRRARDEVEEVRHKRPSRLGMRAFERRLASLRSMLELRSSRPE